MCMVFMIFYSSVAAQASSFAGWMIRVVFRATFTLSSLLRASPVFCLSTKCSIRCSSYFSSWQHRQQKLSLWASRAAEAAERPPRLTAGAAPLIAQLHIQKLNELQTNFSQMTCWKLRHNLLQILLL